MPRSAHVIAAALVLTLSAESAARGQSSHDDHAPKQRVLGEVRFQTSCKPTAQVQFDQAMLYQHSFWYRAAKGAFEEVLKTDPECVIAYWGIAQSLLLNPFGPTPVKNLTEGLAALEKAEVSASGTPRERDYIGALKAFYAEHDRRDHRTRVDAYLAAMETLAQRHPKDDEAQIHYALALAVAASPNDKTYALPLKAAAILEPIFQRNPQHPGAAHYLVHSYDFPSIAHKGVDAARRYAQIAGSSPHALHMPSHIFTRTGHWKESIASNLQSAKVAREDKESDDQLHAMDYLVYAYMQRAQDDDARNTLDEMKAVAGVNAARHTGPFALAASAARYAVERGDWESAAQLPVTPTRFAHVDAITHFARAIGAARSGAPEVAKVDAAKLAELQDKLRGAREAYWAEQVDIQRQVAAAWITYAEGKHDQGLRGMKAAAEAEDRTDKHVVTPGPIAPARELYGAMLLLQTNPHDALRAFEATLQKEPNRLGALLGAAKAAEQLCNLDRARHYYRNALAVAGDAKGSNRPALTEAREFLAKNN